MHDNFSGKFSAFFFKVHALKRVQSVKVGQLAFGILFIRNKPKRVLIFFFNHMAVSHLLFFLDLFDF
jgi:hypothetical protein